VDRPPLEEGREPGDDARPVLVGVRLGDDHRPAVEHRPARQAVAHPQPPDHQPPQLVLGGGVGMVDAEALEPLAVGRGDRHHDEVAAQAVGHQAGGAVQPGLRRGLAALGVDLLDGRPPALVGVEPGQGAGQRGGHPFEAGPLVGRPLVVAGEGHPQHAQGAAAGGHGDEAAGDGARRRRQPGIARPQVGPAADPHGAAVGGGLAQGPGRRQGQRPGGEGAGPEADARHAHQGAPHDQRDHPGVGVGGDDRLAEAGPEVGPRRLGRRGDGDGGGRGGRGDGVRAGRLGGRGRSGHLRLVIIRTVEVRGRPARPHARSSAFASGALHANPARRDPWSAPAR
jgi:hypothetical protein